VYVLLNAAAAEDQEALYASCFFTDLGQGPFTEQRTYRARAKCCGQYHAGCDFSGLFESVCLSALESNGTSEADVENRYLCDLYCANLQERQYFCIVPKTADIAQSLVRNSTEDIQLSTAGSTEDIQLSAGKSTENIQSSAVGNTEDIQLSAGRSTEGIQSSARRSTEDIQLSAGRSTKDIQSSARRSTAGEEARLKSETDLGAGEIAGIAIVATVVLGTITSVAVFFRMKQGKEAYEAAGQTRDLANISADLVP
jgi:hypothetical protein